MATAQLPPAAGSPANACDVPTIAARPKLESKIHLPPAGSVPSPDLQAMLPTSVPLPLGSPGIESIPVAWQVGVQARGPAVSIAVGQQRNDQSSIQQVAGNQVVRTARRVVAAAPPEAAPGPRVSRTKLLPTENSRANTTRAPQAASRRARASDGGANQAQERSITIAHSPGGRQSGSRGGRVRQASARADRVGSNLG